MSACDARGLTPRTHHSLQNFSRNWPVISIKSVTFIASCALVLLSHFLSFRYFSDRSHNAYSHHGRHSYGGGGYGARTARYTTPSAASHEDSFLDVATYFAICVWLVPFYLFLSLSANDNVLPSAGKSRAAKWTLLRGGC